MFSFAAMFLDGRSTRIIVSVFSCITYLYSRSEARFKLSVDSEGRIIVKLRLWRMRRLEKSDLYNVVAQPILELWREWFTSLTDR